MQSEIVLRVAAKGVVLYEGKVLLLREAATYEEGTNIGRWQLPGGRINPGESYEEGLRREVFEESSLAINRIGLPVYVGEWRPVIKGVQNQIIALFTVCYVTTDAVRLSEEHDKFLWVDPTVKPDIDIMGSEDAVLTKIAMFSKKGLLDEI